MKIKIFFKNEALLYEAAVDIIVSSAKEAVNTKGYFTIALSGGNSPAGVYDRIALPVNSVKMPWNKTFIFWSDERYAPPTSGYSNFYKAYNYMLSKVPLNPRNVFRVPVEASSPEIAAVLYERVLKKFFLVSGEISKGMPVFDVIMLGVGSDGHVASLFPGFPVNETKKWVINTKAPAGNDVTNRISFTMDVINSAKKVIIIAPGEEKKKIVKITGRLKPNPKLPVTFVNAKKTIILASE